MNIQRNSTNQTILYLLVLDSHSLLGGLLAREVKSVVEVVVDGNMRVELARATLVRNSGSDLEEVILPRAMDPLLRELLAGIPGALLQNEAILDTVGARLERVAPSVGNTELTKVGVLAGRGVVVAVKASARPVRSPSLLVCLAEHLHS